MTWCDPVAALIDLLVAAGFEAEAILEAAPETGAISVVSKFPGTESVVERVDPIRVEVWRAPGGPNPVKVAEEQLAALVGVNISTPQGVFLDSIRVAETPTKTLLADIAAYGVHVTHRRQS